MHLLKYVQNTNMLKLFNDLDNIQYLCISKSGRIFVSYTSITEGDASLPNNHDGYCIYVQPGGKEPCIGVDKLTEMYEIVEIP